MRLLYFYFLWSQSVWGRHEQIKHSGSQYHYLNQKSKGARVCWVGGFFSLDGTAASSNTRGSHYLHFGLDNVWNISWLLTDLSWRLSSARTKSKVTQKNGHTKESYRRKNGIKHLSFKNLHSIVWPERGAKVQLTLTLIVQFFKTLDHSNLLTH